MIAASLLATAIVTVFSTVEQAEAAKKNKTIIITDSASVTQNADGADGTDGANGGSNVATITQ